MLVAGKVPRAGEHFLWPIEMTRPFPSIPSDEQQDTHLTIDRRIHTLWGPYNCFYSTTEMQCAVYFIHTVQKATHIYIHTHMHLDMINTRSMYRTGSINLVLWTNENEERCDYTQTERGRAAMRWSNEDNDMTRRKRGWRDSRMEELKSPYEIGACMHWISHACSLFRLKSVSIHTYIHTYIHTHNIHVCMCLEAVI